MTFSTLNDALNYHQQHFELIKKLESIVTQQGYQMIEPAYFENYDRFTKMHQRVDRTSMVKLIDTEGQIRVLRPDITTSMMKDLIPKWHHDLSLKLFYNTTIFSHTKGGIKEQKQFGVEYLGNEDLSTDNEIITMILDIFNQFNLTFILEVSHAEFLDNLIAGLDVNDEQLQTLKRILYYKNYDALKNFINDTLVANAYSDILATIFNLQGTIEDIKHALKPLKLPKTIKTTLQQLENYQKTVDNPAVTLDLSMVSQYDYYSGLIYKGYLKDVPYAILNGGRYNTKAMGYMQNVPAIGFSFSLAALLKEVMKNHE